MATLFRQRADVCAGQFQDEVNDDPGMTAVMTEILIDNNFDITMNFDVAPSPAEEVIIDGLLAAHVCTEPTENDAGDLAFDPTSTGLTATTIAGALTELRNICLVHGDDDDDGDDIPCGSGSTHFSTMNIAGALDSLQDQINALGGTNVYGQFFQFVEKNSAQSTSSSTYQTYTSITSVPLDAGTYEAEFHAVARVSSSSRDYQIRLTVDGTEKFRVRKEGKDPNSDQREPASGKAIFTVTQGATPVVAVQFNEISDSTVTMSQAVLTLKRVA